MANLEQPKKAPTAYFLWLSENREAIAKEIGSSKGSAVAKAAGEKWKEVPQDQKAVFEAKAAAAKADQEKAMEDFKSQGGVVEKKKRSSKEEKGKPKDPDAPKKPVGGAYGIFLAEKREEIKKSLPADHKITDVTKVAGERWGKLADSEKAVYEEQYKEKSAAYKVAMEEYKKNGGQADEEEVESPKKSPTKKRGEKAPKAENEAKEEKKAAPKKRAAAADAAPAKRGRVIKASPEEPVLDEAVLKEAASLDYAGVLKNLASRPDIAASGKSSKELLDALKENNGLVNKAKAALLGA